SPGPGTPSRAGRCIDLIRSNESIPLLGVCLGHQAIGEAFGARIVRGGVPVHGKVTEVLHRRERVFAHCDLPTSTARYHSPIVARDSLPEEPLVHAGTPRRVLMAGSAPGRAPLGLPV